MKKTFISLVNTTLSNLELIGEADKKASICAELAKAIAMSGLIETEEITVDVENEEKESPKATETKKKTSKRKAAANKKDALKTEASKEEPIEEEPSIPTEETIENQPAETPQEEPTTPVEETSEDTAEEEFTQEQIDTLSMYLEAWGEEYVYGDCLRAFSEGVLEGVDNITPDNIDGFLVYLANIARLAEEEEQ